MHSSRFPCWLCGRSTDGADTYVICPECADELDRRYGGPLPQQRFAAPEAASSRGAPSSAPSSGSPGSVPLSPDEIEARLRALLDDW
jgi:hypothetical protein